MSSDLKSTAMARATAVARETGWNLEEYCEEQEWTTVGIGPVGRHRDSDALERSNFDVVYGDLRERFGDAIDSPSFGHWGVGWIDEIAFDAGRDDVCDAVERWEVTLADYPVADDMHLSNLEHEELCEYLEGVRLEHDGDDGLEYIVNPLAKTDLAERLASLCYDLNWSRADDVREDDLRDAALSAALLIPSSDSIARELEDARETLEHTRTAIADVRRGIATMDDLETVAHPFVW